jgi:predicted nucleic acid-binding protein
MSVLIDTYALLAAATGDLTRTAQEVFLSLRKGRIRGVVHALVVFEVLYQWRRGKLPGFKDEGELYNYLSRVFDTARITERVVRKAAEVKVVGDDLLRKAPDPSLRARRLSTCDAFTVAIALDRALPVLSGDRDLAYVANKLGVEVLW